MARLCETNHRVAERKRNFLTPQQAWVLLEFCRDSYLGPAVWIQTLAGLRPSEVQALRGKSLLFDLNQILVCAAFNNKTSTLQDHPKQEDWDYSPMPPKLKEYLVCRNIGPDCSEHWETDFDSNRQNGKRGFPKKFSKWEKRDVLHRSGGA